MLKGTYRHRIDPKGRLPVPAAFRRALAETGPATVVVTPLDQCLAAYPVAKVSDASAGASYKTATGFGLPYGDYDMVAINNLGKAVVISGQGDSAQTHGDIWVNRKQ